jgi:two-component system, response regulator PdtaR
MDILIAAAKPLLKLSLEATLDLGGHKVVGPATTAAVALSLAEADRPALAFLQVGLRDGGDLAHALRDRFGIPSFLVGAAAGDADEGRCAAWGLVREPCGSRTVLRAVKIAQGLRQGRRPRGGLPRQIEVFHRPEWSEPSGTVEAKRTFSERS